jgi:hypothetical protein
MHESSNNNNNNDNNKKDSFSLFNASTFVKIGTVKIQLLLL